MASRDDIQLPLLNGSGAAAAAAGGGGDFRGGKSELTAEEDAQFREDTDLVARTDPERGLCNDVIPELINRWGYNELKEEEVHPCLVFLTYFWGPMPVMIWLAIIIELVKAATTGDGWEDFAVLFVLQVVNGTVGYIEEKNAGNAIAALKDKLAPECYVIRHHRDGTIDKRKIKSRELVPGDVVELKLGDVVPADLVLLGDPENVEDQLQVDQSALTGESLPVTIYAGGKLKMSSTIKQGEMKAVVAATGKNTFYGKAADLLQIDDTQGRFQKILFKITLALLFLSLLLCAIIFVVLIVGSNQRNMPGSDDESPVLRALSIVIVLLVASIPIAMQVVCTSTMAVGSRRLAAKKVIVARLSAIEELAGMTVLCSDKTGTLTKNKLTLYDPVLFGDMTRERLIFYGALSSNRKSQNMDAIDTCIVNTVPPAGSGEWTRDKLESDYRVLRFLPFNPVIKRTESTIERVANGEVFRITKGAPQVILRMALENPNSPPELEEVVSQAIQDLADRGFRALGMAVSSTPVDEEPVWDFIGVLSLYDPPRDDTKATIELAVSGGVEVKMITGDQTAIAIETCRQLGMGTEIFSTEVLNDTTVTEAERSERIFHANGFAEVMPEHKFQIVQVLRERGLVVGMTGDGVNDAPALKRADIGIAVDDATDAAKAAADIVLTEPGLSVIIDAIRRSRKIFQRMRNYAIYRIACTLQLLFFFFFSVIALNMSSRAFFGGWTSDCAGASADDRCCVDGKNYSYFDGHFTIPVIALVILTVLNDGCIITISYDKVIPADTPQKWDLREVVIIACVLGFTACIGSMVLLVFGLQANCTNSDGGTSSFWGAALGQTNRGFVTFGDMQTIMYLKVSISDFLSLFSGRCRWFFWERRPGYALATSFVFATGMSTILSLFWPFAQSGSLMTPLQHNPYAALTTWLLCLGFFIFQDVCKVLTYWLLRRYVYTANDERINDVQRRAVITNAIAGEERTSAIKASRGVRREPSRAGPGGRTRRGSGVCRPSAIMRRPQASRSASTVSDELSALRATVAALQQQVAALQRGNGGAAAAADM